MSSTKICFTIFVLMVLLFVFIGCEEIEGLLNTNKPPVIDRMFALNDNLSPTDTTSIVVEAHDPEEESLSYKWSTEDGLLSSTSGQRVVWTAPATGGNFRVTVKVTDISKGKSEASVTLSVLASENPTVKIIQPENRSHIPGLGSINIEAIAGHPNGIREVVFFVDQAMLGRDNTAPYVMPWQIEGKSGESIIVVQAFRAGPNGGEPGVDSVKVSIEGVTRL